MHKARKRFGQNFLHDQNLIERIVRAINPKSNDKLVEIGPGQGALTFPLLERVDKLTAIELDRDLVALLTKLTTPEQLHIISQDVLQVDFSQFDDGIRVVGNLPYNISTPIMMHLLTLGNKVKDMHFMLQKEVVDRLAAEPNSKQYGRLTVTAQYFCQVESLFNVPPECFSPRPKVMSAIVRLTPKSLSPAQQALFPTLHKVTKQAFAMRRKTLKNNLKGLLKEQDFDALGIAPSARAEQLTVEDFEAIAQYLSDKSN